MADQYDLYVGIDWAAENHEICVLKPDRSIIDRKTIEHSGAGVAQLSELLLLGMCLTPVATMGSIREWKTIR